MSTVEQTTLAEQEQQNRPYKAAAGLLLADCFLCILGSLGFGLLLAGEIANGTLLAWTTAASGPAVIMGCYLYFRIIKHCPERLQNKQALLVFYRFLLSAIWVAPHFFAIQTGNPDLYIAPAYVAGAAFVYSSFINLSVARYIAAFIPQAIGLAYCTTLLPSDLHLLSQLTIGLGVLLVPVAYAIQTIFFDYLGTNQAALQYKSKTEKAEKVIKDINLALGDSEKRLQLVADNSHDIIILHERDGTYLFVSNAVEAITGYTPEELIGNKPSDYVYHKDKKALAKRAQEDGGKKVFEEPSRFRFVCKDGRLVWLETITKPIQDPGQSESLAMVSTSRDITKQVEAETRLQQQALLDPLTGCYNRFEFDRQLRQLVTEATENEASHALVYVDLDQFKIINDSCGHQAGDRLLIDVGRRLKHITGDNGVVSRLGGDEFGVLLSNCGTNQASRVANQLRNHLANDDFEHNGKYFSMSASFGIAVIDNTVVSAEDALTRADVACYVAKSSGRNGIHLWLDGDSMVSGHTENIRLASMVKQALENQRIRCSGQLVVPLDEKHPSAMHCEVLTSIILENGERITPNRYLPALESFGLSTEYDHHVVEATLKALSSRNNGQEMGWGWVSINLSAQTVCSPPSLDVIKGLFKRYDVPATCVCFEITETAELQNLSSARRFMTELRDMGCMLALDDFGSGHSSFEHLLNLPFDIVKIDGQFVTDICDNPAHQSIVKSICELAKQLDILTVAEMIEDAPTTEMVRKLGVKYGQGFYLANRQSLEELLDTPTELLKTNPKVLKLFS